MAREGNNPLQRKEPKNRAQSAREKAPGGETVRDTDGAGPPQGGQVDGREGDQEGMKR